MTIKLVIVGSEEEYWSDSLKEKAKKVIKNLISYHYFSCASYGKDLFIASGECPKGGVDIWTKELTAEFITEVDDYTNIEFISFPPEKNEIKYYMKRNMELANYGMIIIAIEPYNRIGQSSGAEWVLRYAQEWNRTHRKSEVYKEICKIVIY